MLHHKPLKLRFPGGGSALPCSEPLLAFDNTLISRLYILRQNINWSVEKRTRSHLYLDILLTNFYVNPLPWCRDNGLILSHMATSHDMDIGCLSTSQHLGLIFTAFWLTALTCMVWFLYADGELLILLVCFIVDVNFLIFFNRIRAWKIVDYHLNLMEYNL